MYCDGVIDAGPLDHLAENIDPNGELLLKLAVIVIDAADDVAIAPHTPRLKFQAVLD